MTSLAWLQAFDAERPRFPAAVTVCAARDCGTPTLGPDSWWCSESCHEAWTASQPRAVVRRTS